MSDFRKRKPNRLKNFDYSSDGVYFITICVKNHHNILWNEKSVTDSLNVGATIGRPYRPVLSEYGKFVDIAIKDSARCYPCLKIHKYVIMPNHVHILIQIQNEISGRPMVAPTISTVIQQMKGITTKKIGFSIWQKSFHDHIVRNEKEYRKIWDYIENNPLKWVDDCYYV